MESRSHSPVPEWGFKDEGVYTDAPQPYGELFVMRYDGTHVEQITDNQWEDGTPAWQPMAVRQLAPSEITRLPDLLELLSLEGILPLPGRIVDCRK